jgi:hypothetical protein
MDELPTITVTLSPDLLKQLRQRARSEDLTLSWLVAGLVCDTIVAWNERAHVTRMSQCRAVRALGSSPAWN